MLILDLVEFTDEEGYGKYLDMHTLHDQFLNLKQMEVCVYCTVLRWLGCIILFILISLRIHSLFVNE